MTGPGGDAAAGGRRFRSLDDPETLLLIVQNLEEGIYITNADGDVLDANPAFLRMFGVSSVSELKFRAGDLIVDPSRRALEMTMLERDGAVRDFELAIVRPDGQRRTVLDTTYVCKDPETGETFYHGILIDITRRKELEIQLREQSIRDALTGCYNRRYLLALGDRMTEEKVSQWGCIYIDIDHFKAYNDQHGHKKGDKVLVQMSRFLMRQVRAEEPVVRLGGDEFLIVLTGENADRTEQIATRLQRAAARGSPVAFSLGWAVRASGERFERTVDRADQELISVRVIARAGDWPRLPAEMERRGTATQESASA
ncbi:MAG TPA: sensor domain-containing diguanylate cyclase [Gemmatimonadaceae bacterium]|nr:sensor domain-containing diguanylate cyclase [Gemmatimonadaceae bacterium]